MEEKKKKKRSGKGKKNKKNSTNNKDTRMSRAKKKEEIEEVVIVDEVDDDTVKVIPVEEDNVNEESFSYRSFFRIKKVNYQNFIILLCLVIFLTVVFVVSKSVPKLTLNEGNQVIDYLEKYEEPGYTLTINGKDKSSKVKVSGKVNNKKLGKYIITYKYKGIITVKKNRVVYVKDKTKPVIMLNGSRDSYICPSGKYVDEGFSSIDNYDGDISKKTKVKVHKNYVKYVAKDKAGNKSQVIRNLIRDDISSPVITLVGDSVVNVTVDTNYQESGVKVIDNCDGDISEKVEVDGKVDTSKPGEYKITYKIVDSSGNSSEVSRTVNVLEQAPLGTVYLTFDDGPQDGTTNVILDILKEEGVKATFFVTSKGPDELIKREADEGHTVALHTATHDYSIYSSVQTYFDDLNAVSDRVYRITGKRSKIIRFPGGSSNTISRRYSEGIMSVLTKKVIEEGYKYYDWNISSGDAGSTTDSEVVYSNVVNNLSHDKINMVLMHDIKPYTRDALRKIIEYCKNNQYNIAPITDNTEMITQRVNN